LSTGDAVLQVEIILYLTEGFVPDGKNTETWFQVATNKRKNNLDDLQNIMDYYDIDWN
jgi:hypothetical protein